MNTDAFVQFVVDFKLGKRYNSPGNELSVWKGIPMEYRHSAAVESVLKRGRYQVRYRGPRRTGLDGKVSYRGKQTCLKADATHFSIYER